MTISEKFRKIILLNECGNDERVALSFSDPDGVRSGKSGWSFGVCQFDLQNNSQASVCLKECGFTDDEIYGLKAQLLDPKPLEWKLKAHADIVERYDEQQLAYCLSRAGDILTKFDILPSDEAAVLAVADYDNQFHLSAINKPGYLVHMLSRLSRPFIAKDVLEFKLDCTKWGKENPEDCRRRYMNVLKVTQNG